MTKTRAFATKSCQNISSSVGFTKTRAFAAKSCQNISTTVGFTKTKVCQLQNHIIVKKDQFDAKGS